MSDTESLDSSSRREDRELVERLKSGDRSAAVEFYNAHVDRIYALVFNQVAGDRDAAQDIVQETFLAAFKSASNFRGQSKVYTWLYSIANKKVADFYRRRKRESKHRTEASEGYTNGYPDTPTLESKGTNRVVLETLSSLPLHYKQVLLLKYIEEMPVSEISRVMQRSPKSVEGLLTRARRELRDKLAAKMRDEQGVSDVNK